jgi:hypothetical protein
MTAEISMTDGTTKFVTVAAMTAVSLVESFERHGFVKIDLEGNGIVYINPAHVASIRDVRAHTV